MKKLLTALLLISPLYAAPIKVVTSFTILEDIAQTIGGDEVEVTSLITADKNAHGFEPTPKDLITLNSSEIVILNGLEFEVWLEKMITAHQYPGKVVVASKGIPAINNHDHEHDHDHDHDHGEFDPHVWQNPLNVITMAKNIKEAFIELAPEKHLLFESNFNAYRKELIALDQETKAALSKLDRKNLSFLILHNSFQYLEAEYGINFVPILGINPFSEPSAKELAELYGSIKNENIRAIFTENIATSRFIETLANDLGINNGGVLYSDALTLEEESNTYLKMFRKNIQTLLKAAKKHINNASEVSQ